MAWVEFIPNRCTELVGKPMLFEDFSKPANDFECAPKVSAFNPVYVDYLNAEFLEGLRAKFVKLRCVIPFAHTPIFIFSEIVSDAFPHKD